MFDPVSHTFILSNPPYPGIEIPHGRYELITGKEDPQNAHRYRLHHPLAQAVIREAKEAATPVAHLIFDYSNSPGKSVKLQSLVGSRGSLAARVLTITTGTETRSRSNEDTILLAATTEDGKTLTDQDVHLLLGLPARMEGAAAGTQKLLNGLLDESQQAELDRVASRNLELFQKEADKLDHWANDRRKIQQGRLDEIDAESKALKKQAREASSLPERLTLQKELRALEEKRSSAWKTYDEESRKIETQRDDLEENALLMLAQSTTTTPLFQIGWAVI
jgi:hypothetical protein